MATTITDRRADNKSRLAGSKAKFIDRYRHHIKQKIDQHIKATDIRKIGDKVKVNIDKKSIEEERLVYDRYKSNHKKVYPGNNKYDKGDKERINSKEIGGSGAGNGGMTEDDFKFILSKEEFLDLLFTDMQLPNFIKKSLEGHFKTKYITGGYIKSGIPARLSVKKTMEMALARRIASTAVGKKPRFIDDIDLRYRNLIEEKQPISKAVMFCIMDVSGSMTEPRKLMAKKFFLLLYLFLTKNYKLVDIRFISHTTYAKEVDEQQFFYSTESGGTMISPAILEANRIINADYDVDTTNIYVAQASDGDNWSMDEADLITEINILLPKIQYMAYIEIDNQYTSSGVKALYDHHITDKKLQSSVIDRESDVIHVLRALFSKDLKNV